MDANYECGWCGKPGELTRGQRDHNRRTRGKSRPCCSSRCAGRLSRLKAKGWTSDMVLEQLEIVRNEVR